MNGVLPGDDLIAQGLQDLCNGHETVAALLVAIGSPRLRRLGIEMPNNLPANPEHRLYDLLSQTSQTSAHSRNNALIRGLVSYERAAEWGKRVTEPEASKRALRNKSYRTESAIADDRQ